MVVLKKVVDVFIATKYTKKPSLEPMVESFVFYDYCFGNPNFSVHVP